MSLYLSFFGRRSFLLFPTGWEFPAQIKWSFSYLIAYQHWLKSWPSLDQDLTRKGNPPLTPSPRPGPSCSCLFNVRTWCHVFLALPGPWGKRQHLRVGFRGWRQLWRLQLRWLCIKHVDDLHQLSHQRRQDRLVRRELFFHFSIHLQQREEEESRGWCGTCKLLPVWFVSARGPSVTDWSLNRTPFSL